MAVPSHTALARERVARWRALLRDNGLTLGGLCVVFLIGQTFTGLLEYNHDLAEHGGEPLSTFGYLETAQFWFESFQNWQSEFLSLVAMVVLSVFLRQRGSPESKPVDAPHSESGSQ